MLCTVVTTSKSPGIANGLTYMTSTDIQAGAHVRVPLRKKVVDGVVVEIQKQKSTSYEVKSVEQISDALPLLSAAQINTLLWMSDYYCCSLRSALSPWLPGVSWSKLLPTDQEDCVEPIRNIVPPELTPDQKYAYAEICANTKPSLLFGVTGSGKTEIYAQMIVDCITEDKAAILLVPEILLTEHSIGRFEQLLGGRERIAVLHSRLTPAQRRNEWKRIYRGECDLVLGSRSALFAPVKNLGLIILDEEHEWTYKNEQTPRYHARDVAQKLCEFTNAKLVLGSATPSLESWNAVKRSEYHMARLPERYASQSLPSVQVVDLGTVNFGSLYPCSPTLLSAIQSQLQKQEQTVLFLNRRGMATALLCMDCRRRVISPSSHLPFTVHKKPNGQEYLIDHTTGECVPPPDSCPGCGSARLHSVGAGTQKIEVLLQKNFPTARILRADKDTLKHPEQMRELLQQMRSGEADILLGTQSVVKGLDLPNVTLAAVLVADVGLSLPHFRAGERIFQLLSQLSGRSGRSKPGKVIIQTFRPDAAEILYAAKHKTEEYLEQELLMRSHLGYPPNTAMIRLLFRGPEAAKNAKTTHAQCVQSASADYGISVAPTIFGGGNEWHVLIRGPDPKTILQSVDKTSAVIDVDPLECC